MKVLLDDKNDTESSFSSMVRYQEVTARSWTFTTTEENEEVLVCLALPFTIRQPNGTYPTPNAVRLYLDGDDWVYIPTNDNFGQPVTQRQWSGEVLTNEGRWAYDNQIHDGSLTATIRKQIAIPGEHTIRLNFGGGQLAAIMTTRSRARMQVLSFGAGEVEEPEEPEPSDLLDVTESTDAAAISSNTANVEVTRESKTFVTTEANQDVAIAVSVPAKYCKVAGANATGKFRLYLDGVLLKEDSGPLITTNSTLPAGPWTDGTTLTYAANHTIVALGTHTLQLRYVGDTVAVCGIAKASRSYKVEAV